MVSGKAALCTWHSVHHIGGDRQILVFVRCGSCAVPVRISDEGDHNNISVVGIGSNISAADQSLERETVVLEVNKEGSEAYLQPICRILFSF